jgi:hypothetical protein
MSTHTKNTEKSQINDIMLHLKCLEKQEQTKLQTSKEEIIIKMRGEISKMEMKKTIQRINKQKTGSLKR